MVSVTASSRSKPVGWDGNQADGAWPVNAALRWISSAFWWETALAAALLVHEEWVFEAQTVFSWKFLITDPNRPRVSHVGGSHPIFTVKMLSYPKSLITVEFSINFGDHLYLRCGISLSEADNNSRTSSDVSSTCIFEKIRCLSVGINFKQ